MNTAAPNPKGRFAVGGFAWEQFRTHAVASAREGAGHVPVVLQHLGDSWVTVLEDVCSHEEEILSFQISTKAVSSVAPTEPPPPDLEGEAALSAS